MEIKHFHFYFFVYKDTVIQFEYTLKGRFGSFRDTRGHYPLWYIRTVKNKFAKSIVRND